MSLLSEIFSSTFILKEAWYQALLLGVFCPLIGTFFVIRRMVFLGVTLPQVAAAGVSLSFLLWGYIGLHTHGALGEREIGLIGAIVLSLGAIGILSLREGRGMGSENRNGVIYVLAGVLSLLALSLDPHGDAQMVALLKGDILGATPAQLKMTAWFTGIVVVLLTLGRRELLLISTDREFAASRGVRVRLWDLSLYLLSGLSVGYGVFIAGPLVVFSLLIIPALNSRHIVWGIGALLPLAVFFGLLSSGGGFFASYGFDLPLGPSIGGISLLLLGIIAGGTFVVRMVRKKH